MDSFDITRESSLGGPTFGLCSAWRFGAFWRFGDIKKNGLAYKEAVTSIILLIERQGMRKPPARASR